MTSQAYRLFKDSVDSDKREKLELALKACREVVNKNENDSNMMHVIGLIECQLGRLAESRKWIEKSLEVCPDSAEVQCHFGIILMEQGEHQQAINALLKALTINPNHIEANYHLGNALMEVGKMAEAVVAFEHAITLKPDYVEALNNLGNLFNQAGRLKEAMDCYIKAIHIKPDYVMAHNNLGLCLVTLGLLEQAEQHYYKALAVLPTYPEAHNNLGIIYRMQGKFDESQEYYRRALQYRPAYPDALNNLGNALKDSGDLDGAIECYEKSLALKESADHRHNLSLALLAVGRYEEGWKAYEFRWGTRQLGRARRRFNQPQWMGGNGKGRTILIHSEQGFGDTLQFCRYAPLVKALGFRVVLEVQGAAASILHSLDGVDEIIKRGQPLPDFDVHSPMMSLPMALKTTVETIPAPASYLKADGDKVTAWQKKLPEARGALRVGLVWAGSARNHSPELIATDKRRSMNPSLLKPLLDVPGIQFYSLQKTGPFAPEEFKLLDFMPECDDFSDTAALVENLDLVISVDTAMVHLTGALGKPVWVLNRFDTCWRWFLSREDSPWYPTARLFRQKQPGDWEGVIDGVREALITLTAQHQAAA